MTDKVQKIREEVARIQLYTQSEVLKQVLDYIDKVQEESNDDWKYSIAERLGVPKDEFDKMKPVSESIDIEQELYKAFGQVKDFTLGMQIAKRFYEMGKNNQEHVSEDLEEASKEWLRPHLDKSYANYGEAKMMELTRFDGYAMLDAIEFGAKWQKEKDESTTEDLGNYINELSKQFPEVSFAKLSRIAVRVAKWQKEQFEKNRLAHCDAQTEEEAEIEQSFLMGIIECEHRQPTFDDAIKYGMRLKEEQMINDAYEREVKVDAGGYPYIPQMELYDYDKDIPLAKEGEKYKVVLIKED